MNKQLLHPVLLICGIIVFIAAILSNNKTEPEVCNDNAPLPKLETAGTHLLWESLSRQFVSVVHY